MGKCKETAGVLYPHPCSREATTSCGGCGRAICELHSRQVAANLLCISCFKKEPGTADRASDPFFLAQTYFPDYDTGGLASTRLRAALGPDGQELEAFEGDFDGT